MAELKDIEKLLESGNVDGALQLADDVKNREKLIITLNDYAVFLAKEELDLEDVEKLLKKVVELKPEMPEAYYNLGCLYSEPELLAEDEQTLRKAIESFEKALELKPDYLDARYDLGLLYAFTGQKGKALMEYDKLLEFDPQNIGKYDRLEGLIKSLAD
ncbi:MAG: tetratricopeptide repeat protein [Candidatus Altiarchaeota archaeon]